MQKDIVINQINDLLIHKQFILKSCRKMINWLLKQDKDDLAFELAKRALVHDNSKLEKEEFNYLTQLGDSLKSMHNPNYVMSDKDKKCIELHWSNNRHHPEYFEKPEYMKEIDIIEMVCDWYARSLQMNTDLIEFVKIRQENRFHFPDDMFDRILKYCSILVSEDDN